MLKTKIVQTGLADAALANADRGAAVHAAAAANDETLARSAANANELRLGGMDTQYDLEMVQYQMHFLLFEPSGMGLKRTRHKMESIGKMRTYTRCRPLELAEKEGKGKGKQLCLDNCSYDTFTVVRQGRFCKMAGQ